jgi:hypothetical protein
MVHRLSDNAEPIGQGHGRTGPARGLIPRERLTYEFRFVSSIRDEAALELLCRFLISLSAIEMTTPW